MTRHLFRYAHVVTEHRWLDERQQRAWRGYLAMHAKLTARLHRQLQDDSGLSLTDFDVLVQLTDRPDRRARVFELAESLQWERSRLSHHLARMQRRGLISREGSPDDGRGAIIALTRRGRSAIERAAPAHVDTVRDLVFDRLTKAQVDALHSISQKVLARLEDDS